MGYLSKPLPSTNTLLTHRQYLTRLSSQARRDWCEESILSQEEVCINRLHLIPMSNMALELSRRVASLPILVLALSASILSAPEAATANSAPSVSTQATSHGALKALLRKSV